MNSGVWGGYFLVWKVSSSKSSENVSPSEMLLDAQSAEAIINAKVADQDLVFTENVA